jgi:D-beta-D-heptose 7-phosphate kinase/D-beta-D-heptose 1-phosphate adenosyltransferase
MCSDLARKVADLPPARILVLGDLILDRYRFGAAERLSPESPAPVFRLSRTVDCLGGAGAVAVMAAALGARVRLLGVAGEDRAADRTNALLDQQRDISNRLVDERGRPTTVKERWIAGGRQLLRTDRESRDPIGNAAVELLSREVKSAEYGALLIADYGKGVCTHALVKRALVDARHKNAIAIVDPARGTDWRRYSGATAIKANESEWNEQPVRPKDWRVLVRTLGSRGMDLWREGAPTRFPAKQRRVVDVCGAGDMTLAALGVCVAGGLDWAEACRVANAAAGLKVERFGASPVSRREVIADLGGPSAKIVSAAELAGVLSGRRAAGRTIVFTNGCFDLLHAGHVSNLREAKAQGDVLVVGLNSNESVRRLKGANRPVQNERQRADVLAALECVDYVTVFEEDTPERLVNRFRPDVLVKGGDYRIEEIAGAARVLAGGGRVHLTSVVEGLSTTKMVEWAGIG